MSKWVEMMVSCSHAGVYCTEYGYWPIPDIWHAGGLIRLANDMTRAAEKWYRQRHRDGDANHQCYRPFVTLHELEGPAQVQVARHWARYGYDDVRQFTPISARAIRAGVKHAR